MNRDPKVEAWLAAMLAEPGLTAVRDPVEARRLHVEDALEGLPYLGDGPVIDVGSGGGSPGLPLAAARPDLGFVLLEATRKKAAFLAAHAEVFGNVEVVAERAEDHGGAEGRDVYGTAVARALAPPATTVEWCLPLIRPGGTLILYLSLSSGLGAVLAAVAAELGGELTEIVPVEATEQRGLALVRKVEPTPARFPRRPGVARKRPLA